MTPNTRSQASQPTTPAGSSASPPNQAAQPTVQVNDNGLKRKRYVISVERDQFCEGEDKDRMYKCPKVLPNGITCNALMKPNNHNISSHESKRHKVGSPYSQKQDQLTEVVGCLDAECEQRGPEYKWANFNSFLGHMRTMHGYSAEKLKKKNKDMKDSELELKKQLKDRAMKAGDVNNYWYNYQIPADTDIVAASEDDSASDVHSASVANGIDLARLPRGDAGNPGTN